jgi:hypothetical protein
MLDKKIIFISYYYPPVKAIGSLRTYFLSKELAKGDWEIYINSTSNKDFFLKDKLELKFCKYVDYVYTFDLQTIKNIIVNFKKKIEKSSSVKNDIVQTPRKNIFNIQKILNSFLVNISYEGGWIYIVLSIIKLQKQIKENNIRFIYSTYSPYANHIIAYVLKKINKNLIWIADFRDLPPGISEGALYGKYFQNLFNRKIFCKAAALICVSEGLKSNLEPYNNKVMVIHNGFNFLDLNNTVKDSSSEIKITYTGSLYGGKRNIEPLLKAIQNISKTYKKIKFIYAGKDSGVLKRLLEKYKLEDILVDKGIVDRDTSLKLQKESNINLMVTWATKKEKGILTGKFFEYIESNKPILCLINGEKDEELENIISSCNVGQVMYTDEINKIESFILEIINKEKFYNYNLDEVNKFSYSELGKKLSKLLEKVYTLGNEI